MQERVGFSVEAKVSAASATHVMQIGVGIEKRSRCSGAGSNGLGSNGGEKCREQQRNTEHEAKSGE